MALKPATTHATLRPEPFRLGSSVAVTTLAAPTLRPAAYHLGASASFVPTRLLVPNLAPRPFQLANSLQFLPLRLLQPRLLPGRPRFRSLALTVRFSNLASLKPQAFWVVPTPRLRFLMTAAKTEQYANLAADTLNGAINNAVTSLVVHSATPFPTTGNFRVLIDAEVLLVTAVSSTTFTVTRAQEGTTAASHADGAAITHIITAGSLLALPARFTVRDTQANRPAAADKGKLWLPSDNPAIAFDDGAAWRPRGPLYDFTAVPAAGWTWIHQDGATATAQGDQLVIRKTAAGTSSVPSAYYRTPANAAPYTLTVGFIANFMSVNFLAVGVAFVESSTSKFVALEQLANWSATKGPSGIEVDRWNFSGGLPAFSATSFGSTGYAAGTLLWFQLRDDNTNLIYSISVDGQNFVQLFSESRTAFLSGAPDKIGLMITTESHVTPNLDVCNTVFSWTETAG